MYSIGIEHTCSHNEVHQRAIQQNTYTRVLCAVQYCGTIQRYCTAILYSSTVHGRKEDGEELVVQYCTLALVLYSLFTCVAKYRWRATVPRVPFEGYSISEGLLPAILYFSFLVLSIRDRHRLLQRLFK